MSCASWTCANSRLSWTIAATIQSLTLSLSIGWDIGGSNTTSSKAISKLPNQHCVCFFLPALVVPPVSNEEEWNQPRYQDSCGGRSGNDMLDKDPFRRRLRLPLLSIPDTVASGSLALVTAADSAVIDVIPLEVDVLLVRRSLSCSSSCW